MCEVILIADSGVDSLSASNPLRLVLDDYPANIQVVRNFVEHGGKVVPPIAGDNECSWESAPKFNGIYLYNYLTKRGVRTALINNYQKEQQSFRLLARQKPKVIAISTTYLIHRKSIFQLVAEVRESCPESIIVVGGPFVELSWRIFEKSDKAPIYNTDEIKQQFLFFLGAEDDPADLYVISPLGEDSLYGIIQNVLAGDESWRSKPNTAHVAENRYLFTPRVDDVTGYKEIPIDWQSLPDEIFAHQVVPVRASMGCPHKCHFCSFKKDHRLTHIKPLDLLIGELKAIQKRGIKYVWFVDDNFRLGKNDIEAVCRRFIDENISLEWMCLIRPEILKDVDMSLLKQAGCREVQMGLESADPVILAKMNKQSDPSQNERVIRDLILAGINCACYFIFGYPGETDKSIEKTVSFIKRLEEHDGPGHFNWSFYPFLLWPFSPIFDNRDAHDLGGYLHEWKHHTMDSDQAKRHVLDAFMALDNSSPIYRGDNLDQLSSLPSHQRQLFLKTRHELEKLKITNRLDDKIAFDMFAAVFLSD